MRRLAYALASLAVVTGALGAVESTWIDWTGPGTLLAGVVFVVLCAACAVTGALVASRVPDNAVGWMILGIGVGVGVILASGAYADLGVRTPMGPLPGEAAAAWLSSALAIPAFYGLTGLLLMLFPTGHAMSTRWRMAAWSFAVVVTIATISHGLVPEQVSVGVANPLALSGAAERVDREVAVVTDWLALPFLGLCVTALAVRLRRSHGTQRQQLKWFTYAAALAGGSLGLNVLTQGAVAEVAFFAGAVGVILLPVTAGIAILRHNLFDIDVVIKRTLVYGVLTAVLVATYLLSVLAFRVVLDPVTGRSDLAVAGSTLAVAALFRPLRARIQRGVDRRFFRDQYDAGLTLESFSGRLRQQVDLDAVSQDLRSVVHETMRPVHVSLWLRQQP
jgi:hypothetical protein